MQTSICKRAEERCGEMLPMRRKLWANACFFAGVCVCIHPWPPDPSRDQPKYVKTVQNSVEFPQMARLFGKIASVASSRIIIWENVLKRTDRYCRWRMSSNKSFSRPKSTFGLDSFAITAGTRPEWQLLFSLSLSLLVSASRRQKQL